MNQAGLTIVVPIEEAVGPLLGLLGAIQRQIRAGRTRAADRALIPFGDLATLHFARFVVLDPPDSAAPASRPSLLFATVHDGPRARHVNELVTIAGEGLLRVFALCDKSLGAQPRDRLHELLADHEVENAAFWGGHLGRSVGQIRAEARLHREIRFRVGPSSGRLSSDPFARAADLVRQRADLAWALKPPDPTRLPAYRKALLWVAVGLVAVALLLTALVWVPWLRWLERRDAIDSRDEEDGDPVTERDEELGHKHELLEDEDQDHSVQNQMTTISDVKPRFGRLLALRIVLWFVDRLGRLVWDHGSLRDIRTIHFACWLRIEQAGTQRLVFLSNYDGSWESYLGEFVDRAARGLTAVWSHTVGFPESRWLFGAGARRELKFKRWVRRQQIPTQVWYSAYPELSVANVQDNSGIRSGLQGLRGLEERRTWLRRV